MNSVIFALSITASINPILTYLAFFQQKEWRFDRIKVGMYEQGILRTSVSVARCTIVLLCLIFIIFSTALTATILALIALNILNILQIIQTKQRLPTWTQKTKLLTLVVLVISSAYIYIALYTAPFLAVLTPLVQICFVAVALILLTPLDIYLKQKIFTKAKQNRNRLQNTTIIAITGSVGKTTCKHMLAQLLQNKNIAYTPAFVNSELGVCNWFNSFMQTCNTEPDVLIVEMGAYKQGEIALLCTIFQPNISIITYIGTQHIALFGSKEQLLEAKTEIVKQLPSTAHAIFPAEHSFSHQIAERTKAITHAVALEKSSTTSLQTTFSINNTEYVINIAGIHNALNCALAIEAALLCSVSTAELQSIVPTLTLPESTFIVTNIGTKTIVDDSHNSSPESTKAIIEWAKNCSASQKILCMSGIIEQGSNQEAAHATIAKDASTVFEYIVCSDAKIREMLSPHFSGAIVNKLENCPSIAPDCLVVCEGRVPVKRIQQYLESTL